MTNEELNTALYKKVFAEAFEKSATRRCSALTERRSRPT